MKLAMIYIENCNMRNCLETNSYSTSPNTTLSSSSLSSSTFCTILFKPAADANLKLGANINYVFDSPKNSITHHQHRVSLSTK